MRSVSRVHQTCGGVKALLWFCFLLAGCSDVSPVAPAGPNLSEDPSDPGSSLVDVIWGENEGLWGYMDVAQEQDVQGTFPEWDGRDPAVDGLPAGSLWSCPAWTASTMIISTYDHGTFIIAGVFQKQFDNGTTRHGYPTARYSVPAAQHYNTQGNYYIYGGSVDVECQGGYVNLGFKKLWVGNLDPYQYYGSAGPSNRGARTGSNGWVYQNASHQNGSSGGGSGAENWQTVLQLYIDTGQCTEGWSIYVDGVKAC